MSKSSEASSESAAELPGVSLASNLPIVMVIDDEHQVLDVARRLIERMGYQVLSESDPSAALARYEIEYERIGCVFIDLSMQPIDGLELFAAMQKINIHGRVILCSGYNDANALEYYLKLGFASFLPKPYRMNDLRQVLADVLNKNS